MNRIALVTGANRGIGYEVCRQLSERGYEVILTARDRKKGESAVKRLGRGVSFQHLDVTDGQTILEARQWVQQRHGRLDVLVNNAGISKGSKGFVDSELEEVRDIMETNFYGPMRVTKAFLPLLRKSADGCIINVSSGMGALEELTGGYAGYRLSKAGLNAQTILLANELKGSKIRVYAVCPGWVRTDMGGRLAPRSVEEGADTIIWLATTQSVPPGKSYRDRREMPW
jgi:NAD(P)-dependent dehydrogenase (short-subunit alcohol dehydrogenase family)